MLPGGFEKDADRTFLSMRTDFLRPAVIVAQERRSAMESTMIAMGRLTGFPRLAHLCAERGFGLATRGTGVSAMPLNPSRAWITPMEHATQTSPVKSVAQPPMRFVTDWMTIAMGLQTKALVVNRGKPRPFRAELAASRR